MNTQIDHLVVMADTLSQGVAWCEATLGVVPAAGGEHDRYGTHNAVFKIASPKFPLAYFEIIALNPGQIHLPKGVDTRWFDMDEPLLRTAVKDAPRLIHFVANTPDIQASRGALRMLQIERGTATACSRASAKGTLHWQISVRPDGQRLFDGCLPSLIQWGKPKATEPLRLHPRNTLPRSGVTLQSLSIHHASNDKLQEAFNAIGLNGVTLAASTGSVDNKANLIAVLKTPKGEVTLESLGI
jgi:Glyoxalase-like domain